MSWALPALALGALVIGFIPPALIFARRPDAADRIGLSAVPLPAWVFIAVWVIIYPAMGVAAWQIWHAPAPADVRSAALAVLTFGYLQTLTFWLNDSLRGIAIIDATGVLASVTTCWVLIRLCPSAVPWIIPWMIWMPVTLAVKITVLQQRAHR